MIVKKNLYADAVFVLYFLHDKGALYGCDVIMATKHIEKELLITAHVWRLHAEHEVKRTADVVTLRNLRYTVNQLLEVEGTIRVQLT